MFRIRFDKVPNENTKFVDIDGSYIKKGLIEVNDDDKYANLTSLGELYGIELAIAQGVVVLDSNNELTDFGIKWIAEQFAEHKIDSKLLAKVKT